MWMIQDYVGGPLSNMHGEQPLLDKIIYMVEMVPFACSMWRSSHMMHLSTV